MHSSFCPSIGFLASLLLSTVVGTAHGQTDEKQELEVLSIEDVGAFRPEHSPDLTKARQLIFERTNEFRMSNNRSKLDRNEQLDATAQDFAGYMAKTDRYGHTADGSQPSERAKRHGYESCLIAENIAYQFATESFQTEKLAKRTLQGWVDSPGHRRNMLKDHVTEIGVGIAQSDSTGIFYAVQVFGRPRAAAITFSVKNEVSQPVEYTLGDRRFTLPGRYVREHRMCVPEPLKLVSSEEGDETDQRSAVEPENEARYRVTIESGQPTLQKVD